jgi:riboflavin kinase
MTKGKGFSINGCVVSGVGEGIYLSQFDWVVQQIHDKFGFRPFSGTFNLKIKQGDVYKITEWKKMFLGEEITSPHSPCAGIAYKVMLADQLEGALIYPKIDNYPEDICEILAPIHVRDFLKVKDNDQVRLVIYPDSGLSSGD